MKDQILPQDVTVLDVTFGVGVVDRLMPKYEDIPKEFKDGDTKWNKMFSDWFFAGLKNLNITAKEGIDVKKALNHLKAIIGSFEPSHEHKEAAAAYLMSLWFEDASWEPAKRMGK